MMQEVPLRGACSCGRNQYLIAIPSNAGDDIAQVFFDDSAEQRRALSTPLPTFLRIPLTWLHSTTYAFYPDETHNTIRRVFTPQHAPFTKRQFCGFCGTPLSLWSEESKEEAEWVCVNMGSLQSESVEKLGEAGLLPGNQEKEEGVEEGRSGGISGSQGRELTGAPWFEEIIKGSELGRMRRSRGGEISGDGRSRVEWEIVEFGGEDDKGSLESGLATAKRKIGQIVDGGDVDMRSG